MKRRVAFLFCVFSFISWSLVAQQITRLAVVDVQKVMLSFYRESKAMREYEDKKAKLQADIDRMQLEIKDLQRQKAEAETKSTSTSEIEKTISLKTDYLKQFYASKSAELEEMKKKMFESNQFVQQVYAEIQAVAEKEGFSLALDLKASNGIIWYSPAIDITDKVIQNLVGKIPQ